MTLTCMWRNAAQAIRTRVAGRAGLPRARRPMFSADDERVRRRLILLLALALEERQVPFAAARLDLGSGDGARPGSITIAGDRVQVAGADGLFAFITESGHRLATADRTGIHAVADLIAARASGRDRRLLPYG